RRVFTVPVMNPRANRPVVIGVQKENVFGTELENTVAQPLRRDGERAPPAQGGRMLTVEHFAQIRPARRDGLPIRQIAEQFGHSTKTVLKALAQLERTTLADVIERNTGVRGLQDNVFFFKAKVSGQVFLDRNGDGRQQFGETALQGVSVE